jgi:PAS domain S-box-containing protein
LAVTLNSIGDAVIATDAEARVTILNPLAEKLTGWTMADAIGRPVDEIFHIINQETRLPSTVPVKSTLEHGTIQGLANHTIVIARNGNESIIADSCAPIHNREGQVIGAVLVFRDVSDEYRVQQALRDNTSLVQTILNTVVDGIITFHADTGIIETVNPAAEKMFGYIASELIKQDFNQLIPETDRGPGNSFIEYYNTSAEARALGLGREVVGLRKDGSTFPMEVAVSEMWLRGERYFTGILRDITERNYLDGVIQENNLDLKFAKAVAEKANQAKSDFLSRMSHELRTPLNAILGFAQLLQAGTPPPTDGQNDKLHEITKAGWYLLELINEILDLAVIESGKLSLSRESVSLTDVMHECEAMVEAQAQKHHVQLNFIKFDSSWFANADRIRVKQVLINLLVNAIKYNRKHGAVDVECTADTPGLIHISIRDCGKGLSPKKLAQLFQPFNRLGQENGTEEGTGMGLVVAKQLVELMGGSIGVQSTVGTGSEFWIELVRDVAPLHPDAGAQPVESTSMAATGTKQRTLLYVEDNPANLMLVEQIVKDNSNVHMLSARDAYLGISLAREHLPDVILMDINLPGMSGIEALKILQVDPETKNIPVVALSANAIQKDIEHGLEAGFFRYLTKPIRINEFMKALDEALEFSRLRSGDANEEGTTP